MATEQFTHQGPWSPGRETGKSRSVLEKTSLVRNTLAIAFIGCVITGASFFLLEIYPYLQALEHSR